MNTNEQAKRIVDSMMEADSFSRWLGIEILDIGIGSSVLKMAVRDEMLNGFQIAHGGITYSLADSALAFASNSTGQQAVSVETSISHVKPVFAGDILTATATEESRSRKIGIYKVEILNQKIEKVALFKGVVYFMSSQPNN